MPLSYLKRNKYSLYDIDTVDLRRPEVGMCFIDEEDFILF